PPGKNRNIVPQGTPLSPLESDSTMTKDNETTENAPPAEAQAAEAPPADAQAARPRKIVRRSASTREHPAFTPAADEAAPPGGAPKGPSSREETPAPAGGAAPEGRPRATYDARAPRPRATFDARAPRPRPSAPSSGSSPDKGAPPRRSSEG